MRTLIILLVLFLPASLDAQATLSLSSTTTPAGGTANLTLSLTSDAMRSAAVQWTFEYSPSDFTKISVVPSDSVVAVKKQLSCYGVPGQLVCLLSGMNATIIQDGPIAVAALTLSTGGALSRPIKVSNTSAAMADAWPNTSSGSGGTVTVPATVTVSALTCAPSSLTGPGTSACTVILSGPAPAGGVVVSLTSNNVSLTVPASATVAANSTTGHFTATAGSVATPLTAVVTAALNGSTQTASLSLAPLVKVTALVCAPASLNSGASSSCTVTLSSAAPTGGLSVTLSDNTALLTTPTSVAVAVGSKTATFIVTAGTIATTQTGIVTASLNGSSTTASLALTAATTTTCPCSIWPSSATPTSTNDSDGTAIEVGVKFNSSVAGHITGVRFYKGSKNTGTHVGHLWTRTGTLLGSITFTKETASGWQQMLFATPISIAANTTYVVSVSSASYYSDSVNYFATSGVTAAPLTALKNGQDGSNGVYVYGKNKFPTATWNSTNYWVDVVYQ